MQQRQDVMEANQRHPFPKKLVLMVGLPGSGKTTYIKKKLPDHIRVCHDDIYQMMTGIYKPEMKDVYHLIEDYAVVTGLITHSVVVDRTCLDAKTRNRFIKLGLVTGVDVVAIVMTTPLEIAKTMNFSSDRVRAGHFVDEEVYERLLSKADPVAKDEGFSEIVYIDPFTED